MPPTKQRTPELRDRIVDVALRTLAAEGPAGFTTRRVAAGAGTSPAALYELFGDRAGLVRELFFEGFRRLGDDLDAALTDDDRDPLDAIAVYAATFRGFALRHRHLADLMYSRPFADFDPSPDDLAAGERARAHLVGCTRRAVDARLLAGDPVDIAHVLLATAQGLAMQEAAGWLGSSATSTDRRWSLAIDGLLAGLRAG